MILLRYLFITCFLVGSLQAEETPPLKKPTICLNMIVKNESQVIHKGLETVKPFIDYWVVVDTGSTDNTQNVIKEFMKDIPGEVYDRPWVDFSHNRNEALQLAKNKADYILWMDADDYFELEENFSFPLLKADYYTIVIDEVDKKYERTHLIRNDLNWYWKGVLHEYLTVDAPIKSGGKIEGIKYRRTNDGARSRDPLKYKKDAQVLEAALEKEPGNDRYWFYLAQTYKIIEEYQKAIDAYQKRVDLGGWQEEVFYSLLQIGIIKEMLKKPDSEIQEAYLKAHLYRPSRPEPLYYLGSYFRRKGDYYTAYYMTRHGVGIPPCKDCLFLEDWITDYGMVFEHSICCYWVGEYKLAKAYNDLLLKKPHLPPAYRESVISNNKWVESKLGTAIFR